MEELLIKYSFGECTPEELPQVALLFEQDEALKQEHEAIKHIDALALQQLKMMPLDNGFEQKLSALLTKEVQVKARPHLIPELNVSIDLASQEKSILRDNLGPILFATVSLIFVVVYGGNFTSSTYEMSTVFSSYSIFVLLGSMCLLGLFFMDQILSKKQGSKHFMFSF